APLGAAAGWTRAPVEPAGERLAVELGQLAVPVDPDRRFHQAAVDLEARDPVRQRRHRAPELADQAGVPEEAVLQGHTLLPGRRGARAQHEPREIDLPP